MLTRKLKNQAILLVSLAVLAALIYLFNDESNSLKKRDKNFAFDAMYSIRKIHIENNDTSLILTNESGNNWIVNNHYPVNERSMKAFRSVFSRLETVAPVARVNHENISQKLFNQGIRVMLYENARPAKTYYFYYDPASHTTYGSLGNKEAIFALKLKAAGVDDIVQYFNTSVGYWKDNHIFKLAPGQIHVIQVQYPGDQAQSFSIDNTRQPPVVYNHQGEAIKESSSEKIYNYLYYYASVKYDQVIDPANYKVPAAFATVTVLHETDTTRLQLHRKPAQTGSQNFDLNVLLGKTNYEYCLMKYVEVDPLLQKLNYFMKK